MLDLGTARIAELFLHRFQFAADHLEQAFGIFQNFDQAANGFQNLLVFVGELFLLQSGQTMQTHRQNFQSLRFGQLIAVILQAIARIHFLGA